MQNEELKVAIEKAATATALYDLPLQDILHSAMVASFANSTSRAQGCLAKKVCVNK